MDRLKSDLARQRNDSAVEHARKSKAKRTRWASPFGKYLLIILLLPIVSRGENTTTGA